MALASHRYASIAELARALQARRLSAVELAEATLSDLERVGRRFNAIANLTRERALEEARSADRAIARGRRAPLLGVPYGAKDLVAARGAPTTWGTPEFADQIIDEDATVGTRLRRRGAVLAAKLAMVELAGGGRPSLQGASLQGQPRNPWDPAKYSGGSSSGPGIAVAAGLLPYALGTETGGSILGPCAYSGVTGIRPTYGLVPRTGVMELSGSLDKVGVLARTADDLASVLAAIAGPDGLDETATGRFRALAPADARAAVRRARVGIAGDDVEACAPTMRKAIGRGLDEFRRVVRHVVAVGFRADLPYANALELIVQVEGASAFEEHLRRPDFDLVDAKQKAELRAGLDVPASDYLRAMGIRPAIAADARRVFSEVDVVVSASRAETAPRLDAPKEPRAARSTPDRLRAIGNLGGLPGVFVPCGFAEDGMPVGLQLVGPRGAEPLLLALASAYQRATDHHTARPPLAA